MAWTKCEKWLSVTAITLSTAGIPSLLLMLGTNTTFILKVVQFIYNVLKWMANVFNELANKDKKSITLLEGLAVQTKELDTWKRYDEVSFLSGSLPLDILTRIIV